MEFKTTGNFKLLQQALSVPHSLVGLQPPLTAPDVQHAPDSPHPNLAYQLGGDRGGTADLQRGTTLKTRNDKSKQQADPHDYVK